MRPVATKPTHVPDMERRLLGAMILSSTAADSVADLVEARDFVDELHRDLFVAITKAYGTSSTLDPAVLAADCAAAAGRDQGGVVVAVAGFVKREPTPLHARDYARHVAEASRRRRLRNALDVSQASAEQDDIETAVAKAESAILSVDARAGERSATEHDALRVSLDAADRRQLGDATDVLPTGFRLLDDMLGGGLRGGQLVILAARPAVGKSAFGLSVARHVGAAGRHAYFASLEMTVAELGDRLMAAASNVSLSAIRTGTFTSEMRDKMQASADSARFRTLSIDDRPDQSVASIAAKCRRCRRLGRLGLVVIDYLQLLAPADPSARRELQVATMARELKLLARQLKTPVLCLAQLNREADGIRPRLSHLRESGAIEQDADGVWLLHSPHESGVRRDLIVAKQRNGPTGTIPLSWHADHALFTEGATTTGSTSDDWTSDDF